MENQITTIQIRENVKRVLESLKEKAGDSYEDVIARLLKEKKENKIKLEALMIEGCKEMYNDSIEINRELESADADIDWEWNNNGDKKRRHSSG